ncbi:oxidoreductase, short chain dehydrogenase/reductase family protein (macronuclear) [Tetrahymena thermophila SB210]|uniref:Oxidoreductase, short chain dehydrogenase/reductase family protein n=1 Tax=Tetrahymena thermophila (strain SB210) TaxID=312017 RepID=I7MGJ1_TETTS|nr:oxidoreductase, short chain dehydrogenase/reductase family protein [Tetrahymena thermophila SB210]EAS01488.1 oxidoreductase, short chain dehydrogenase/reductase family protein [Tetrahymena thermophila SB210]|eukprot:XP_001021734.1 oxidoreductase, short chain dehydrogenase/reductase family protein [Tetrahymena thermophila SB210]
MEILFKFIPYYLVHYTAYAIYIVLAIFLLRKISKNIKNNVTRDLSNQIIVITGANSGIGFETAKNCVQHGAKVVLACRDEITAQQSCLQLNSIKKKSTEFIKLDLSDSSSIRQFANIFKKKYSKLDILVNNAGVMAIPNRCLTKEGFEQTIGVNYFGHFLLTQLLLDHLKLSSQFRVINVSSVAHLAGTIDFQDLHFSKRFYHGMLAYFQSKIANILFTISLQKKFDDQKLSGLSVSLHPGIVQTNLFRHLRGLTKVLFKLISPLFNFIYNNSFEGAQTTLYCIHQNYFKLEKGAYYSDCQKQKRLNNCITPENADILWNLSMKIFGL